MQSRITKNINRKVHTKLNELNYKYVILNYDKEQNKITKKYMSGKKDKPIYDFNKGCELCKNNKIKQTEFDIAFKKYIEEEFGDDLIW